MKAKLVKESLNESFVPRKFGSNPRNVAEILKDEPYFFGDLPEQFPEILNMKTLDEHGIGEMDDIDNSDGYGWLRKMNAGVDDDDDLEEEYFEWLEIAKKQIRNNAIESEAEFGNAYYNPELQIGYVDLSGDGYEMIFFNK